MPFATLLLCRAALSLMMVSLVLTCRHRSELTPTAHSHPSTNGEVFDVSTPSSGKQLKAAIYQFNEHRGPHYEYRYLYDGQNRLVKLVLWGYMNKSTGSTTTYEHRVASLTYDQQGQLTTLQLTDFNDSHKPTRTFQVTKEGTDLVVYNPYQDTHKSPFDSLKGKPVLRLSQAGQVKQVAAYPAHSRPLGARGLSTLSYDASGNLKGMELLYPTREGSLQQVQLVDQIEHAQFVRNPLANNAAYQAAHFVVFGGVDYFGLRWHDLSQQMVLSTTFKYMMPDVSGVYLVGVGSSLHYRYTYRYNADRLPVFLKRTRSYTYPSKPSMIGSEVTMDSISFVY